MGNSSQNQNTKTALHYHESTKHSEESLRANTHFLDGENKPLPFKVYRGVESVPLMRDPAILDGSTPTALEAISIPVSQVQDEDAGEKIPDLATLSQVLFLTAGITKQKRYPGGAVYFRGMRRFKSAPQAQRFLSVHAAVHNLFNFCRNLVSAKHYRLFRQRAFASWENATAV